MNKRLLGLCRTGRLYEIEDWINAESCAVAGKRDSGTSRAWVIA